MLQNQDDFARKVAGLVGPTSPDRTSRGSAGSVPHLSVRAYDVRSDVDPRVIDLKILLKVLQIQKYFEYSKPGETFARVPTTPGTLLLTFTDSRQNSATCIF